MSAKLPLTFRFFTTNICVKCAIEAVRPMRKQRRLPDGELVLYPAAGMGLPKHFRGKDRSRFGMVSETPSISYMGQAESLTFGTA